jgi:FdhD protein
MRTPGNDWELAAGFLFTEGLIRGVDEIESLRYCGTGAPGEQLFNVVAVQLRRPLEPSTFQRNFFATSSCGVCGKAAIEQVEVLCERVRPGPQVSAAALQRLPGTLRAAQEVFDETGGLHATGLFTPEGALVLAREDVGRHNAMDKLVGHELLAGNLPLHDRVALVSGRASFELVQKAAVAGIPVLCAVSAPSTLAVDAARRLDLTLVGFLRGERFNIYTHRERIVLDSG